MQELISIIILSWNRKDDLIETLNDLKKQTYGNYEILVVDQASTDGTQEAIENNFKEVRIIKMHRNIGVPGGRNVGAVNAKGRLLVFLDNDASLNNEALETVEKIFVARPEVGIIGFKILNAKTKELDVRSWVYQKSKMKHANHSFDTFTYCGAGHAIRKDLFKNIGYYWDDLFFCWEEVDFSIGALNAGYSIEYNPSILVYHRMAPEKRTSNILHECLRLHNGLWVLWTRFPKGYAVCQTFVRIGVYFVKSLQLRCFIKMTVYCLMAFRKFGLLFTNEKRISLKTFKIYCKLSDKGKFSEQIKHLFLNQANVKV